jgi:hypothetical protein
MFKNIWSSGGFPSWSHTKPESALTCLERESNKHYIICLSKSAIFPSNKVEFCHQNLELSIKKCGFSANFAQVFSFGPDAFVAAPQAVETRALQPLGCHGEIMVGGFRMN